MLPLSTYQRLCERYDAEEFARRYPHAVLLHLSLGSQMLASSSPRETLFRGKGMGTRRHTRRASGSPYVAYRLKKKSRDRGHSTRISIGFLRTNDVVIQEASVSRVHAYIENGPAGFSIIDAGSSNGVKVNDTAVTLGRASLLRPGDRVSLGNVSTLFLPSADLYKFVRKVASLT
jgi:hypothetical protein